MCGPFLLFCRFALFFFTLFFFPPTLSSLPVLASGLLAFVCSASSFLVFSFSPVLASGVLAYFFLPIFFLAHVFCLCFFCLRVFCLCSFLPLLFLAYVLFALCFSAFLPLFFFPRGSLFAPGARGEWKGGRGGLSGMSVRL